MSAPLNICLVSAEFPPLQGGVGDYTWELGVALAGLGHTVSVVTSAGNDGTRRSGARPEGVRVLPVVKRWDWGILRQLPPLFAELGVDVVQVEYQTGAYAMHPAVNVLPWRLRLLKPRPLFAITYHDVLPPYLFPKAGPVRDCATFLPARAADAVIVTNVESEVAARERLRNTSKLWRVPIGSNIACRPPAGYDRAAWRANLGFAPDDFVIGYFGFLNESKGGDTLIRALRILVQEGVPVRLLMAGGRIGSTDLTNVAYAAHIDGMLDAFGLAGRVVWTGYAPEDEVSGHLLAADVLALPYRDGASPRRGSLMAALAHGRAVVSTGGAGDPDLRDDENIRLVSPDDPLALASALAALWRDLVARARLETGALALSERYAWPAIAQKSVEIYEAVGAGRGR